MAQQPSRDVAILDKSDPLSPLSVPPSQTAVLLLDYHKVLFGRITEAEGAQVIRGAQALASWARSSGALIVHGLIDLEGAPRPTFKGIERVAPLVAKVKQDPSVAAEHPEIAAAASADPEREITVKRTMGVFSAMKSRGINEVLQKHGIRSLIIGGISTSGCVLRTSTQAADEDYIITIASDACADPSPAIHEAVLGNIVQPNSNVVTTDVLAAAYKEAYGL